MDRTWNDQHLIDQHTSAATQAGRETGPVR